MIRRHPIRTAVVLVALVLLALIGREVHWAWNAVPGTSEDFAARANKLVADSEALRPGDNGWPHLLRAGELAAAVDDAYVNERGGSQNPPADWPRGASWPSDPTDLEFHTDPDGAVRTAILEIMRRKEAAGVYAEMDAIVASDKFIREIPRSERMLDVLLPELGQARKLARLNAARMRLASKAGAPDELVAAYTQTLALGDAVGRQVTLIDHLVGFAIGALANNELRIALVERPLPPAALRKALATLDRYQPQPLTLAFEGERIFTLDMIQWTHTDDGNGSGRCIPADALSFSNGSTSGQPSPGFGNARNLFWFRYPSKADSIAQTNAFYDSMQNRVKVTRQARLALPNEAQIIADLQKGRFESLALVLPALGKAFHSADQYTTDHAATRVMLAIELYRAEKNAAPPSLAALVPEYIPVLPPDALSGAGFGYFEVRPGADTENRLYLLYSFGADGVDNDAKIDAANPHTALAGKPQGTDYIYNAPRPPPVPPGQPAGVAPR